MSHPNRIVSTPSASVFVGDLCCERLCTDAMADHQDLGDIINDHADRAMTLDEVAEFNEWAATQNYPITSR